MKHTLHLREQEPSLIRRAEDVTSVGGDRRIFALEVQSSITLERIIVERVVNKPVRGVIDMNVVCLRSRGEGWTADVRRRDKCFGS